MTYLKYKLDEGSYKPMQATEGAACYDLYLPIDLDLEPGCIKVIPLSIAFDIPDGWYIEMFPRSSLLAKHSVIAPVSIIDSDYKQNVHAILYNVGNKYASFKKGDRLLQFLLKRKEDIKFIEVNEIEDKGRGGLGSTGL